MPKRKRRTGGVLPDNPSDSPFPSFGLPWIKFEIPKVKRRRGNPGKHPILEIHEIAEDTLRGVQCALVFRPPWGLLDGEVTAQDFQLMNLEDAKRIVRRQKARDRKKKG